MDSKQTLGTSVKGTSPRVNPWIVMVSTPNAPDGLFEKIEREPEEYLLVQATIPRLHVRT